MLRFPNIEVQYDLEIEDFDIASFSIQPLVENAIKHGIRSREHGIVRITTRQQKKAIDIIISDNGIGFDTNILNTLDTTHVGIRNVQSRLKLLQDANMNIRSDTEGTSVARAELASIFWEDEIYNHSKQKQLDVFIQSLKKTLKEYDILSIFEIEKGELRVNPLYFQCDFYDLLDGKQTALQAYCDNYMNAYSWAESTKAYLSLKLLNTKE